MANVIEFPGKFLVGQVFESEHEGEKVVEVVIPFGYEEMTIYGNGGGDICIKQTNYGECEDDVTVVIPRLYLDSVIAGMGLVLKSLEDVSRL
jgi:hypothetical protein